jgi:sortase A
MTINLRKFNNILTIFVVFLGLYIILSPFLPALSFLLRDKSPNSTAPYAGALAESVGSTSTSQPAGNRIVIPDLSLDEEIFEGNSIALIENGGTWLRPNSATPTENGNTVIVGHRFYGNSTSTFYNLDKLKVGQKIAVYWYGEEIVYEITETKVVDPSAVEIEAPTNDKRLTLYTCTPIWTAKNRLVVIAKPVVSGDEERRSEIER